MRVEPHFGNTLLLHPVQTVGRGYMPLGLVLQLDSKEGIGCESVHVLDFLVVVETLEIRRNFDRCLFHQLSFLLLLVEVEIGLGSEITHVLT